MSTPQTVPGIGHVETGFTSVKVERDRTAVLVTSQTSHSSTSARLNDEQVRSLVKALESLLPTEPTNAADPTPFATPKTALAPCGICKGPKCEVFTEPTPPFKVGDFVRVIDRSGHPGVAIHNAPAVVLNVAETDLGRGPLVSARQANGAEIVMVSERFAKWEPQAGDLVEVHGYSIYWDGREDRITGKAGRFFRLSGGSGFAAEHLRPVIKGATAPKPAGKPSYKRGDFVRLTERSAELNVGDVVEVLEPADLDGDLYVQQATRAGARYLNVSKVEPAGDPKRGDLVHVAAAAKTRDGFGVYFGRAVVGEIIPPESAAYARDVHVRARTSSELTYSPTQYVGPDYLRHATRRDVVRLGPLKAAA